MHISMRRLVISSTALLFLAGCSPSGQDTIHPSTGSSAPVHTSKSIERLQEKKMAAIGQELIERHLSAAEHQSVDDYLSTLSHQYQDDPELLAALDTFFTRYDITYSLQEFQLTEWDDHVATFEAVVKKTATDKDPNWHFVDTEETEQYTLLNEDGEWKIDQTLRMDSEKEN